MSTSYENTKFGEDFLDQMVEFVHDHNTIDELYTEKEIRAWLEDNAKDYGYVEEE